MKNLHIKKVRKVNKLKRKRRINKRKKFQKKQTNIKNFYTISKFYKLLILFFMIIFYYLIIIVLKKSKISLKVCLCTVGKEENKYILEFVEHYKKYGIDKIYLYDNNNIEGEHFEEVINNYIKSGFVEIVDFRGQKSILNIVANDCYRKNYMNYDWLIFYEIDEYIHLRDHNIKSFLNQNYFNNCEVIYLNWIFHTDNNKLYYENRPLKKRFPEIEKDLSTKKAIKSILKGGIPNIIIENVHTLNGKLKNCDGYGRPAKNQGIGTYNIDYTNYYIDHYSSKSTEEFAKKINKGDVLFQLSNKFDRIKVYFQYNELTKEKIDYFDKNIPGFSTSSLKNELMQRLKNN